MEFRFKQFTINQERSAMKVGTDGVLLGAWAPVDQNPNSILDIGSGTGLVALMLAQRSDTEQIDAIEIVADAYEEAVENFENSPWADRLFCYHAGLDEFMDEPEQYDLIVSNPPFHGEDYFSGDAKRDAARFTDSLPFEDLIEAAGIMLSGNGIFCVIIPYNKEGNFIALANQNNLFPVKVTRTKGTPTSEIKRSLIAFGRKSVKNYPIDELVIELARHVYSDDYIALTREFYLKMP